MKKQGKQEFLSQFRPIFQKWKPFGQRLVRRFSVIWRSRFFPKKKWQWLLVALVVGWIFSLPKPLFDAPLSFVLEDRAGNLLGAKIAADGQWRFPAPDSLPENYVRSVLEFEDRRFRWHPGFDPIGLARAMRQNFQKGKIVSGGSTISMQVIRLARGNRRRSFLEKFIEIWLATRLELTFSKNEILNLYAANAPFGGNVVGLEAASWRYFGKKPALLSWAEAATLAVLPNSPSLIHPGKNRQALLEKRNRLLDQLFRENRLSETAAELAKSEPLPEQPQPLPQLAPHLLDYGFSDYGLRIADYGLNRNSESIRNPQSVFRNRLRSSVRADLQQKLTEILARCQAVYRENGVHNLAAVVLDVRSGEVLAWVGNVVGAGAAHGESVDLVTAARSTGSILKPYLYALALESGDILPNSLLTDVPTQIGQYKPENFYHNYDGAVPARRALVRSLNVPFVRLLQQYGLEKFHFSLKKLGFSTISKPPDHYGLSLILGGAEANLLEITNAYASMARTLTTFSTRDSRYDSDDFRPASIHFSPQKRTEKSRSSLLKTAPILSAGSTWFAFEAMQQVERPNSSGEWELFEAGRKIAWKTGTSIGFRDAWAAGVTPDFAVGVWVGNADGEGRPGLIGVEKAAPILFEIFENLPSSAWFSMPYDDLVQISTCRNSGFRATEICPVDSAWVPKTGLNAAACPFHEMLHLDATGQFQVSSACESPGSMRHESWFVLPALQEFYFKQKTPGYASPPPVRADCLTAVSEESKRSPMQLIYPKNVSKIKVPRELSGQLGKTIFEVAHRQPEVEIFWHLDENYLGSTRHFHQKALAPPVGKHRLTLVDAAGNRLETTFEIVE